MTGTITIVGANLAGGRAAEALRMQGFDGRIVLIGAERHPPYERPPLSKEVLLGRRQADQTYVNPLGRWNELAVDLMLGRVATRLLPRDKAVELDDGEAVRSDQVLLCTGARVRRLPVAGAVKEGVHYLRTLDDAEALQRVLQSGCRVVVVGAGFVGCEVASSARQAGCEVTLVEATQAPMERVLGAELGAVFARLHRDHGVKVLTGVGVQRIEGGSHVEAVVTSDDRRLPADVVVVGIGVTPAVELAEGAGIVTGDGIIVDAFCRTSVPNVLAAGDVANHPNAILGERLRLEHWQNAQNQAVAAAGTMLGGSSAFSEVPWFWSDQYDVNLQMAGHPRASDNVVWRGIPDSYDATAFFLRDGALAGALSLNRPRELRAAMKLVEKRAIVGPDALADPSIDLRTLLRAA